MEKAIIIIVLVGAVGFFSWHYLFSIYETRYEIMPEMLYADSESIAVIKSVPLNALGNRAPLRDGEAEYEIIEGYDLVEVVENDSEKGVLKLRALDKAGIVKIRAVSPNSLLPALIEIPVLPNSV